MDNHFNFFITVSFTAYWYKIININKHQWQCGEAYLAGDMISALNKYFSN